MTQEKFEQLRANLAHLKSIRPAAAAEVARLAELGDFSENAEYQLAKGRLRGINNNMLRLEHQINNAEVISSPHTHDTVQVGSTVEVRVNGILKKYHILGSSQTDPEHGIISYTSPLGEALLGASVGETVELVLANRTVQYTVEKIY